MSTSFFANFKQQALKDELCKGDTVRIIGKDSFKGWIGTVVAIKEISREHVYTVELQANNARVDRYKESLRKEYS